MKAYIANKLRDIANWLDPFEAQDPMEAWAAHKPDYKPLFDAPVSAMPEGSHRG